jgi:hypothetical protein
MNDKEILKNKPEGASNVSDNGVYYYSSDGIPMNYWTRGEEWVESGGIYHLTRSIADIRRIAELESMLVSRTKEVDDGITRYNKSVSKQQKIIAELETQLKMAKADGVREVAKQMNTIYASEHNQKKVPPGQFGRLYERLRRLAQ